MAHFPGFRSIPRNDETVPAHPPERLSAVPFPAESGSALASAPTLACPDGEYAVGCDTLYFFRAESRAAPELLTKIIYAGPIPAVVIVWIYGRLREQSWQLVPLTLIPDAGIFTLALFRFPGYFPFSGHAIFLGYLVSTAGQSRLTLVCSLIMLLETIILKLTIFGDPDSLWRGLLLMIPLMIRSKFFARQLRIRVNEVQAGAAESVSGDWLQGPNR